MSYVPPVPHTSSTQQHQQQQQQQQRQQQSLTAPEQQLHYFATATTATEGSTTSTDTMSRGSTPSPNRGSGGMGRPRPATSPELLRCKRRVDFGENGFALPHTQPPVTVARRNERERNRVKMVNMGFATLRNHVPLGSSKNKKMSKVDTLRAAVDYIKELKQMLHNPDLSSLGHTLDGFMRENVNPSVQSLSRSPSPCLSGDPNYCSSPEGAYGSTTPQSSGSGGGRGGSGGTFSSSPYTPNGPEYAQRSCFPYPPSHLQQQHHYSAADEDDFLDFPI